MSIRKDIHKRLAERVDAQSVPDLPPFLPGDDRMPLPSPPRHSPWTSLTFHLAVFMLLVLSIAANSQTRKSLQRIDPGDQKGKVIGQKLKSTLARISVYFGRQAARDDKGVKK